MASTLPAASLESSSKTDNFWRLIRLLIKGGRDVLQLLFDSFFSPKQLSTRLARDERLLRSSNFFPDQLEILYPGAGKCVESKHFDITLLSRLLQMFCPLPTPLTGWKVLPKDNDTSVEADFVRIKIYRNMIYAHNTEMELDDGTFQDLWRKISDALIRIASNVSKEDGNHWNQTIANFEKAPLTECDKQHRQSLSNWYNRDKKIQEISENLEMCVQTVQDTNKLVKEVQPTVQDMNNRLINMEKVLDGMQQQQSITKLYIKCCSFVCLPAYWMSPASSDFPEPTTTVITGEIANGELKHPAESRFRKYVENDLGAKVIKEEQGSLIITVECASLETLQRFWEEYTSGRLNEMAEKYLVTQELLDRFGLKEVRLCTTVDPEEYKRGRRELIILKLGEKVTLDLECIIGNVERLIDEGDVSAALQLISDKKKEQEFKRETNLQPEKGIDEHKKSVKTASSFNESCHLTTCNRAEQDLAQVSTDEREDAVNSTNDVNFCCQPVEIRREHETPNQSQLDHRINREALLDTDENKDPRGTTSSGDECRQHPKCSSRLTRSESMQQEIIVKTDDITGTSQHLARNNLSDLIQSEDPTELTKLTPGVGMVTNQIECIKISNVICPQQLHDQDLENTELPKIDIQHFNPKRKTNNTISETKSIYYYPPFRQGSTTPKDLGVKGVSDYKKKKSTKKKSERDYIIKTNLDLVMHVLDMLRNPQTQNVLQETDILLEQTQTEYCTNESQENLRAIQSQDRQKPINANLEKEKQKDGEFSLDAKKHAVDAKDRQRVKKKLKSEETGY